MERPGSRSGAADLVLAALAMVVAAVAARNVEDGTPLRVALTLPALLVVPGYLVLQALFVPARPARARAVHAFVGLGVSPAVVGLAALATSVVPGGFRPAPIVVMVTATSLVLAGIAYARRAHADHRAAERREAVPENTTPGDAAPPAVPEFAAPPAPEPEFSPFDFLDRPLAAASEEPDRAAGTAAAREP